MISYLDSSSINYLFYVLVSMILWGAYRSFNVFLLIDAQFFIFFFFFITVHGVDSTTHIRWALDGKSSRSVICSASCLTVFIYFSHHHWLCLFIVRFINSEKIVLSLLQSEIETVFDIFIDFLVRILKKISITCIICST